MLRFVIARALVRVSSWLVPSGRRSEWRAEWDGELAAHWKRTPGWHGVAFALPAVAEGVAVVAVHVEAALGAPLEDRDRVAHAVEQHVDRLAPELGGVEAVEQDRTAPALRVPDLPREDGFPSRGRAAGRRGGAGERHEPLDSVGGPPHPDRRPQRL